MAATYESKTVGLSGSAVKLLDDQDEDRLVFLNIPGNFLVEYTSTDVVIPITGPNVAGPNGLINGFVLPAGYELWVQNPSFPGGSPKNVGVFTTKPPQPGSLTFTCS